MATTRQRQRKECECGQTFYTAKGAELCPECERIEATSPAKIEIDNLRSGGEKD